MIRMLYSAILAAMLAGCATIPVPADPVIDPVPGVAQRSAVILGLTRVDPGSYGGWNGDCPGCDVDASTMALLCREQGLTVSLLTNQQATAARLIHDAQAFAATMRAGDLLVIYVSGHGGQEPDSNGDEADGLDETICLWDGQLVDDRLAELWQSLPAGIRVLFITDTCNSGTNYRHRRSIRKTVPRSYQGQLIHIGGCADGLSSFGSASGGAMTTAMIDAWRDGIGLRAWFEGTRAAMRGQRQVPVWAEYGGVADTFRHGRALW